MHVTDLTLKIGSQLEMAKAELLRGDRAAEILALPEQRGVLVFKNLSLSDEEHLAFAETLGEIRHEFGLKMMKVTFDKRENPLYAEYFSGTFSWHMDGTWDDVPAHASIIRPQRLAKEGGQTEFANTSAAFEALGAEEQARIIDLRVIHTMESAMRPTVPDPSGDQLAAWRSYPVRTHPLVWRHRSGRKSLVMSTSSSHVIGMSRAESDELLARLWDWCTRPEFIYRHRWEMGDLVIWDNTGTIHRVLRFDQASGRRLHRVTLCGIEPLAPGPVGGRA